MSLVELRQVVKRYGTHTVLDQVDLRVESGEIVAVIGRSGSGKSTLLRCINGLEPVQAGEVEVDGVAVHRPGADLRGLRARVGFVFQSYNLFPHLTAEKNITLGPRIVQGVDPTRATELARQALRRVGLEEKCRPTPTSSPAVSSSVWRSRAAWRCHPSSCCSTRSPRPWTRNSSGKC